MCRQVLVLVAVLLAVSSPAAAQTYVSGSLVGDFARFSHADTPGVENRGGEAVGFGLRVGTSVTDLWGVELEFVRPSLIDSTTALEVVPSFSGDLINSFPRLPLFPDVFAPIRYELTTETRNSTMAASLWAKQQLTGRFSLVYSGGIAVLRSHQTATFQLVPGPGAIGVSLFPISFTVTEEAVEYSVRPVVGAEARIDLTAHVQLMPGVRLYGLARGVLLRPAVGLSWTF